MKRVPPMASLVCRFALVVALLALACAPGGDATQPPPPAGSFAGCAPSDLAKIAPLFTCVATIAGTNYAVFGYRNDGEAGFLPHGAQNELIRPTSETAPPWSGVGSLRPPTAFPSGNRRDVLVTPFLTEVRWQLGSSYAEATSESTSCAVKKESGTSYIEIPGVAGAPPTDLPVWRDDGIAQTGSIVPTDAPVMQGNAIGTLHGSFAVTEDGAATFQVPLWVPQGTAGMQPGLALTYSSRHANGLLGVGWSLSGLSQIARCAKTQQNDLEATEVRFDNTDRFCLDGDFLALMPGSNNEYRPQHDPYTRVRIEASDSLGPTSFRVEAKDGRVLHYGGGSARLEGPRLVPDSMNKGSVIDSSTNPSVRLTWFLDEARDRVGNAIRYAYENRASVPHHLCQVSGACVAQEKRIHEITYAHFGDLPATRKVAFIYEDRPDRELIYVSGFPVWRSGRLQRIETHAPAPVATSIVKQYRLTYHAPGASVSGRSLLASVAECDAAGVCKVTHQQRRDDG